MIVLDTSGLFALLNTRDSNHDRAMEIAQFFPAPFVLPVAGLGEIAFLVESRLGAQTWATVMEDIEVGAYELDWRQTDLPLASEVLERMPEVGFVDAVTAVVTSRRRTRVMSFDLRHFVPLSGLMGFELAS